MSDLKEMALKKMAKNLPKTKRGLEDFIHGVSPVSDNLKKLADHMKAEKKELPAEVKVAKEHLKKVDCKVVPHTEMDKMESHKEVIKHLEDKKCPEVAEVKKKVRALKKAEKAEKSEPVAEAPKSKKPRKTVKKEVAEEGPEY